jgi:hypothetical protein
MTHNKAKVLPTIISLLNASATSEERPIRMGVDDFTGGHSGTMTLDCSDPISGSLGQPTSKQVGRCEKYSHGQCIATRTMR